MNANNDNFPNGNLGNNNLARLYSVDLTLLELNILISLVEARLDELAANNSNRSHNEMAARDEEIEMLEELLIKLKRARGSASGGKRSRKTRKVSKSRKHRKGSRKH